jgi:hypothetical protein
MTRALSSRDQRDAGRESLQHADRRRVATHANASDRRCCAMCSVRWYYGSRPTIATLAREAGFAIRNVRPDPITRST